MKRKTLLIFGPLALMLCICPVVAGILAYGVISIPQVHSVLEEIMASVGAMAELQQALSEEYPAGAVQVGIMNGHVLTISLVNSDANRLSLTDQQARAKEIATFARVHYAAISDIDRISVTFVQQAAAFGVSAHMSQSFIFTLTELPDAENAFAPYRAIVFR